MEKQEQRRWLAAGMLGLAVLGLSLYGSARSELPVAGEPAAPAAQAAIIVYVSGAVNHPGVIQLERGKRAIDAINGAGGLAPGADAGKVNLALPLTDGMQLIVPAQEAAVAMQGNATVKAGVAGKVSINSAGSQELDGLPGIGPAMAQRIVDYRTANGAFQSLDDLKKVKGIGAAKFERIKDKISL